MGGEMIGPAVRRSPDFYSPQDKALIEWGESQGMQFLPGQRTGNRGQQMFEAGLRSDADWATTIKQYDANNDTVMNRIAYEAMGIPRGKVDAMTPDKLREHKDMLQAEYQALEAGTVGRIDAPVMREMDAHIKSLESLKGSDAVKNAKAARAAYENLQNLSTRETRKDARGRFVQRTFDGKEYQTLRTNLKDQITKAYNDGNVGRARALQPMLDQLDAGMEKGIRQFGGEASAAQWKDLNERYAMTKLFIEKGSTPTGNIDPARLTAYFQSSDPERMLLESGGRVTDLHKLAKLNYVMKNQAGSALTGTGMMTYKKNPTKQSMRQRLLSSPAGSAVPFIPEMMLKRYAGGYPSVSGYLGMGIGDGLAGRPFLGGNLGRLWDHPGLYTRALAQGTQVHPAAIEGGIDSLDWLIGKGEEAANTMQNLFTIGNEEQWCQKVKVTARSAKAAARRSTDETTVSTSAILQQRLGSSYH